ncbi:MAG TPA: FAD-binding oxidoreductase [Alphaproteobacteria bacterium]|nr:FAD-binding oxidoreductase [Alphaproteobacteria bacterium]
MNPRKISRRNFIRTATAAAGGFWLAGHAGGSPLPASFTPPASAMPEAVTVNDIHSQLNATTVRELLRPGSIDECQSMIKAIRSRGGAISVAGGRHSMGGQQFADDSALIDTRSMGRVLGFDRERGLIEVEAGIQWPELIQYLHQTQEGSEREWAIVQKQTGADHFTLGGSLSSNVHGRALDQKPIVGNVESFTLIDHEGEMQRCSRQENPELFRLAIGGYGLFGTIASVTLRLRERVKVRRVVEIRDLKDVPDAFEQRIQDGYLYGDFQFATDSTRPSFLQRGVFSCYQPVPKDTPVTEHPTRFSPEDWAKLTYYTHKYKRRAFDLYSRRYLQTSGQVYWSDSQLFGNYLDNYHQELDRKLHASTPATEMITEIDVPRPRLADFMEEAAAALRKQKANVIYGVVRLIEKDDETFLAWAKERYACVVFNLHVPHDRQGIENAARNFQTLIDLAIKRGGSYYLTYHRFARREQVESCYPQFEKFLRLKRQYDPTETFQSNWYRHYREMFST